ncbi:MAG: CNNM domain-containing protein, partial [Deltaproteobacteria bacterium]|nr:CNNM domain-containing protein [Deltaproteobacteria bacterium]
MEIDTPLRLYLVFFLFWGLVFFTTSEAGLFSLGRLNLQKFKEEGHPRYSLMERLLHHPRRLIITLLIGNEIFTIALSSLISAVFISLWGETAKWAAIPVIVLLILLPGEVIPKTLAMLFPEKVSPAVAPWVDRFGRAIKLLVDLLITIVDGLLRLFGVGTETGVPS